MYLEVLRAKNFFKEFILPAIIARHLNCLNGPAFF